jgi:tetratricopeptide (TPR) repeat protein
VSPVEDASSTFRNTSITKESSEETRIDVNVSNESHNNPLQTTQSKMMENFIIVWLNLNINDSTEGKDDLVMQFRSIISTIKTFTDINECVDFLTDLTDEKVFMIIDDYPNENFLSILDEISPLHSIYIFNQHQEKHEQRNIVRGIYAHIEYIYNAVKHDVYRLTIDLTPVSIISPNSSLNLDELDQSFMYTQLLKETIMDIEYDAKKAREEFTQFCLSRSATGDIQPSTICQFQRCYEEHSAIWWYTKEWFVYSSLNRALRTQDIDFIPKMGFFVQDLHREIEKRHAEIHDHSKIVVYRGQGLSNINFEKLQKSKGGLFSFNNFLSTSVDRDVSFTFADSNQQNREQTAVLFKMEIDPSISSTPFARIGDIGQFETEAEILFSMHTVFRIGDMKQLDTRLWEVNLTLTDHNDQQLKCITDYIRNEIGVVKGWDRMAILMMKMGRYDKLLEIYNMLAETLSEGDSKMLEIVHTFMGNNVGIAQQSLGNYSIALSNYEKFLKMIQELRPWDHTWIANINCNIGSAHYSMADFSSALLSYEKALESQRQSLSPNSVVLARIYNNIAKVYVSMGDLLRALEYFGKALEIDQKSLPSEHPDIAADYINISEVHRSLCNYSLALSYIQKALEIQQKYLPPDHPDLAACHNNIGALYSSMGNYTLALSHHEKAVEIQQKSFPSGHPDFAKFYNNIAALYQLMGNPSDALSYLKKTLEIQQKFLPSDHSDSVTVYNNIGEAYRFMGDHSSALSYYEKALEMSQKFFSSNHPNLAIIYNNIGLMHQSLGNYSVALSFYQNTLKIQQEILPPDHPDLGRTYNNIAYLSQLNQDFLPFISNMENALRIQHQSFTANHPLLGANCANENEANEIMEHYSATLSDMKRVAEIQQKFLPFGGSNINITDENIEEAEELVRRYFTMLSSLEKVLELQKKSGLVNFPLWAGGQGNVTGDNQIVENCLSMISNLKTNIRIPSFNDRQTNYNDNSNDAGPFSTDDCSATVTSYQKLLEMSQNYMPSNDVSLTTQYNNLGQTFYSRGNYANALSLFEKALESLKKCVPVNQQLLAKTHNNIAMALDGLQRYREAIDYAKQAVDAARSALGSSHVETQMYQNYFDQLKRKL